MECIEIATKAKKYPVLIGHGTVHGMEAYLSSLIGSYTSVMVITDETVAELYLSSLKEAAGFTHLYVNTVPSGEKAKTFDVYYACLSAALEHKLDRNSLILAFGGGAVGDLAGFVAATYMRGIRFIQIPTTILAHDSAVGGKVAINHPLGKNMIGAFHQPEAVIYDLDFLGTLPDREVRSGFAEVIKHSLISEEDFYFWLRNHIRSMSNLDPIKVEMFLSRGIKIKGAIVAEDERENGVRAYLNFGHTLGHAIEAESGFGKLTHGEAVVIGMVFALQLSIERTGLEFNLDEFKAWLRALGYRVSMPEGLEVVQLVSRIKQDKKTIGKKIRFVLLNKLGVPAVAEVDEQSLVTSLLKFKREGE